MPRVRRNAAEDRYKCRTCDYSTDRKSSIDAHNNRKVPCTPAPFVRMVTLPDGSTARAHKDTECRHCGKVLATKKSLKRHFGTCKSKKHDEWALQNQKDEVWNNIDTKRPLVEGKFRCIRCHHDFNSRQALHMHTKRICPSIKNVVLAIDKAIEQKPPGQATPFKTFKFETSRHINDDKWLKLCRKFRVAARASGAVALMSSVWFNRLQPQNHTVRYTNKKLKYVEVWNGARWTLEDKNYVADQILEKIANDFDCYLHNNIARLRSITGEFKYTSSIIAGIKEMVDIILLNKKPTEKRKVRTLILAKMHEYTKKVTLWASANPYDKELVMKHQAALECARKVSAEDTAYSLNREMEKIKTETKKEIDDEVQRRVTKALLQIGVTQAQIDEIRRKCRGKDAVIGDPVGDAVADPLDQHGDGEADAVEAAA